MEFEQKLVNLGMNVNEAKIYIYLINNKNATATEIAKNAKISRTLAYQILDILIQKNFVTEIRGNVRKYSPVPPEEVMNRLEEDLINQKKILDEIRPELVNLFNQNDSNKSPSDFIQVLYTKSSIISKIESLEANSKKEVLAFNKPPYVMNINKSDTYKISNDFRSSQKKAVERGIKFRSIYEIEEGDFTTFQNKIRIFESQGEEVRIIENLPMKMFVFDSKTVALALRNKAEIGVNFVTLIIDHADFAKAMEDIFNIFWKLSKKNK